MHPYGACFLCDTCYGFFHLLAGCHYEVGELVDYHHDIGEVAVAFFGIESFFDKPLVVFQNAAYIGVAQKHIALVHLHAERIECGKHFVHRCYDGLLLVGQFRQIMAFEHAVEAEFHHLRVNKHEFQFGGMLFVEQRCDDCIESHRFAHASCTGHKQVGHLAEVGYIYIVGYGGAHGHRQLVFALLEFLRAEDGAD